MNLQNIQKLPIIIVAELSNKGNLITKDYTQKCIEGAFKNPNIVGFVSQKNLGYNKCIYCKPGINLNSNNDDYDQQYTGKTDGIDFYIVGRAITNHIDPLNEIKKYKKYFYDNI